MVEIKGAVLCDSIKAVKVQRDGEQTYNTIVDQLKGETRTLFKQEAILPAGWVSLDAFVEFLEVEIKVTAQGNEQELIKWTEAVVERQLRGIYRMFVKLGTPQFVLNRLAVVHKTYFRGVTIEVSLPSPGKGIIKYTGFAKQHRLMGLIIIGFYRKALELSGAKDVTAKFTTSIEDNKGYCELFLTWSGK
jgi:hypothetical protein